MDYVQFSKLIELKPDKILTITESAQMKYCVLSCMMRTHAFGLNL